MVVEPVPSPLRKSPPWQTKLAICFSGQHPCCVCVSVLREEKEAGNKGETNNAVELGALVALGPAVGALGLAGAELAEVLSRLGADVVEELESDAAEGFT